MQRIIKKNFKNIIAFSWAVLVLLSASPIFAQNITTERPMFGNALAEKMRRYTGFFELEVGFNPISLPGIIAVIIFVALSVLSILFIILIFYGGYKWMMARGNEQEVEEARAIIRQAIIGLIVLLASYAFGYFILYYLITGGSGEGAPNTPYN